MLDDRWIEYLAIVLVRYPVRRSGSIFQSTAVMGGNCVVMFVSRSREALTSCLLVSIDSLRANLRVVRLAEMRVFHCNSCKMRLNPDVAATGRGFGYDIRIGIK